MIGFCATVVFGLGRGPWSSPATCIDQFSQDEDEDEEEEDDEEVCGLMQVDD